MLFSHTIILSRANSSYEKTRYSSFLADSSGPSARLACIGKNKLSEILSLVIHPKTHSPPDARKSQPNQRPLNFV